MAMEFLDLLTNLLSKAARWNSIGIQLGLSPDQVATIRADSSDVEECLRKILQKWYDMTPNPSWGQVITALRAPLLGEMKLAKELEQKMVISLNPGEVAIVHIVRVTAGLELLQIYITSLCD
jgi:hypothetical protein